MYRPVRRICRAFTHLQLGALAAHKMLAGMFLLTLACGFALWLVFHAAHVKSAPSNLTLADALDDLWSLVRVPMAISRSIFPSAIVEWVQRMSSDRLFSRVDWLDPRKHSWRFACLVGLLVGILLILGQLQTGPATQPGNRTAGDGNFPFSGARCDPGGFCFIRVVILSTTKNNNK